MFVEENMLLWIRGETREGSTGLNYPLITRKETLISVYRTMQFPLISLTENEFKGKAIGKNPWGMKCNVFLS
jgi:hypothetical protein